MIRRILVCLADDTSSLAAQEIALNLARDAEATVTCLATVDTHSASLAAISPGIGTTFYAVQAAQAVEDHLQKVANERIARFHARAEELHVPCVARLGEGIPWQSIELASCFHDLLVIGRGAHFDYVSEGKPKTPGRSLRKLLDHSSCPLLVVSSAPLAVAHLVTGLDGRMMVPGTSIIMAESVYKHDAPLGFLFQNQIRMTHNAYRRSRLVDPIPRVS